MVTSNLRSLGEKKEKSWIKTDYGDGGRGGEERKKQLDNSDVTTEEEKKKGMREGDGGWSGWSRRSES